MATSNDNNNQSNFTNLLRMTCLEPYVGFNQADAKRRWSWLKEAVASPCNCKDLEAPSALLVLQHLYDRHVGQDWKAARLETWVMANSADKGSPLQMSAAKATAFDKAFCSEIGMVCDLTVRRVTRRRAV